MELARLLVSAGLDKGSVSKLAGDLEGSLKSIEKKSATVKITPKFEDF